MEEFDGVRDMDGPGMFVEDTVTAIVMQSRADVESINSTEVPGATYGWFVVDEHLTAGWAERSGVKVERAKEGVPCRGVCWSWRWAQQVQGELSLREEEVPPVSRKGGRHASQNGKEVIFECADGAFRRVAAVHMGWHQLEGAVVVDNGLAECAATFIVHDV